MSEVFDEDTGTFRKRTLSNGEVLAFIARYWMRQPWRYSSTIAFTLVAIGFEAMMPRASQSLVDALRGPPGGAPLAWKAWAFFVGVYLVYNLVRNIGFRFSWNPLAAANMEALTNEAFARVQSFSADWHGDNFAGATVRKISRAMWGYDVVSDSVIMWIGPALVVLAVLSVQMMLRWPLIGGFSLLMVAGYIV